MASFAGHAHRGGYAIDKKSGIHFRVFESVLETPRPHMVPRMDSLTFMRTSYGFVVSENATVQFMTSHTCHNL